LQTLARRLSPGYADFDIRVVDVPMVNAAALPGNHIVIFRELITEADTPDEVAGVLAHEIAHVRRRHVTEGMIRELGVGLVITALGGTTGGNADMILGSRYGRAAEAEADADAIAALRAANISPLGTARFFTRMGATERKLGRLGAAFSYLSTHPLSDARRAKFRASFDPNRRYTPALSRDEWEAIFNICFNDPAKRAARGQPRALRPLSAKLPRARPRFTGPRCAKPPAASAPA
jgi:predicted Zn-dependent protease